MTQSLAALRNISQNTILLFLHLEEWCPLPGETGIAKVFVVTKMKEEGLKYPNSL
jgi:hypothetical protein